MGGTIESGVGSLESGSPAEARAKAGVGLARRSQSEGGSRARPP